MRFGSQCSYAAMSPGLLPTAGGRQTGTYRRSHFRQRFPLRKKPGCHASASFQRIGSSNWSHALLFATALLGSINYLGLNSEEPWAVRHEINVMDTCVLASCCDIVKE